MSNRGYLRGHVDREAGMEDGLITFTAATEGVKADGIDLRMDGAQLDRFKDNPVILFGHNSWGRENLPIGRAPLVEIDGKRLRIGVQFDQEDEFARKVERKIRAKFLNAVSIGFDVQAWEKPGMNHWNGGVATKWELFETSVVPVPMDDKATVESGRSHLHDENLRQYMDEQIAKEVKEGIARYFQMLDAEESRSSTVADMDAAKMLASLSFGRNN